MVELAVLKKALVEVRLVPTAEAKLRTRAKLVGPKTYRLVEVAEVVKKLVEVKLVKIPVLAVVAPIGVSLIELPVERVRLLATKASMTELAGK